MYWCILMGEMRSIANVFLIYGLDPDPDLTMPPKEGDRNKAIVEQASQFLRQYDDAVKQQESKAPPVHEFDELC